MLHSVGLRLAAATVLIISVTAAIAAFAFAEKERRELFARKEQATTRLADQIALTLAAPLEFDDDIAAEEALVGVRDDPEVLQLRVLDRDRPAAIVDIGEGVDEPVALGISWHDDGLWVTRQIADESGVHGVLVLGVSIARDQVLWTEQRNAILGGAAGLALLVAGSLIAAARRMVVQPLSRLADAVEAFGRGEPVKLPEAGQDEVGRVAHAFAAMMDAIGEREGKLAAAHAEVGRLLDAMRQAVLVFGPDLVVTGRSSRAAPRVFARDSIDGIDVRELLLDGQLDGSAEAVATREFLDAVFEIPLSAWPDAVELAPREITLHADTDHERALVLEFVPLTEGDRLARVMVVVTDETEERKARREMEQLRDRHAQEIDATRRLLGMGANVFVQFCETTATRLSCVDRLLAAPLDTGVGELIRQIHAVRGDARALGLVALADELATAESLLADVRDSAAPPAVAVWTDALRAHLMRADGELDRIRRRLVATSPLGDEVLDQTTVSARDLHRLGELREQAPRAVRAAIDRVRARMLGPLLVGIADTANAWAALEGKRVQLEIRGATARVDVACAAAVRTAIVQVVRNAIAHGIEAPALRTEAGKPELGTIAIDAKEGESGIEIEVTDDGIGVGPCPDAERAANDLDGDVDVLPRIVGRSTRARPDALAGRGVGLAALRDELRECGYEVRITSKRGVGTRVRLAPIAVAPTRASG